MGESETKGVAHATVSDSDATVKGPTSAQLEAAGLVAVTTYEEIETAYANGQGPLRTYNATTEKFPPVTGGYVTKPKPPPVPTPAPTSVFTAAQVGTDQIEVSWSGFSPTEIARSGVDSSGTGAWNTGPLTGQSTSGTFTFNDLIAGDTYTLTITEPSGATLSATVTITGATPTPTPSPAGPTFTLPAPESGWTRTASDDFTSTTMSAIWTGAYNGKSQASQDGYFIASHCRLLGDGWMRLEGYTDQAGMEQCWEYDASIGESVNYIGGAGNQTVEHFSPPLTITWIAKWDTYPNLTDIFLSMGIWPPEIDWLEVNAATKGGLPEGSNLTSHYGKSNSNPQVPLSYQGINIALEHIWQAKWTTGGVTLSILDDPASPVLIASQTYTAAMVNPNDEYSLAQPQFFSAQIQTGDPGNPAADPTLTSANPVTLYLGPIAFDIPAVA